MLHLVRKLGFLDAWSWNFCGIQSIFIYIYIYIHIWTNNAWNRHIFCFWQVIWCLFRTGIPSTLRLDPTSGVFPLHQPLPLLLGRALRTSHGEIYAGRVLYCSVFWWNLANLPNIFCIGRIDRLITAKSLEMKLDHLRSQYVVDWNKRLPFESLWCLFFFRGISRSTPICTTRGKGGEDCHFAHDESQLREKPNLYRTHGGDLSRFETCGKLVIEDRLFKTHQQALFRSHH